MAQIRKQRNASEAVDWSALTSIPGVRTWGEALLQLLVFILVVGGLEFGLKAFHVPEYIFPTPSAIVKALISEFPLLWPHLLITLKELVVGFAIGASIGLIMAAFITQIPLVERIISPYVIVLVTTPMVALVPLLILQFGFGSEPRIIAVALSVGPMVMVNSSTGFRRVDSNKIALARSYGANTLQIFMKIRFPMALPMINVGFMVGGIFGTLTAVAASMVGGKNGLGNRLAYYSSLVRMPQFFATILILIAIGLSIYAFFYWLGKRYAWEE